MTFRFTSLENPSGWPSWPTYGLAEQAAVQRVIASNQLFAAEEVKQFEDLFKAFLGIQYAVGVGNATQGLHLALAALDIGVGDEVIVTPYSWISSSSCVLMQNATAVYCDIESDSLGLDPDAVAEKITPRTKAIIAVHPFGYPIRIQELADLAARHEISLIEDGSHALGATVREKPVGTFGRISVFSLQQRKALSVGDGGMVCTHDERIAEKISRLRSFGDDELSYNYRMTEFSAAIGSVRIGRLREENALRLQNAERLASQIGGNSALQVMWPRPSSNGVFYAALLRVTQSIPNLETNLQAMREQSIPIRSTWSPLHQHPHFNPREIPARGFPVSTADLDQDATPVPYAALDLPIANSLLPSKVLELYVHPPTDQGNIDFALSRMKEFGMI